MISKETKKEVVNIFILNLSLSIFPLWIYSVHAPLSAGGSGEPPTKFWKREVLDRTSVFRRGLVRKREVTFFLGEVCHF